MLPPHRRTRFTRASEFQPPAEQRQDPAAEQETPPPCPSTPAQIHSAVHFLQRASRYRLPHELVKHVLAYAAYDCLHFHAHSTDPLTARASDAEPTPATPYIETPPLRGLDVGRLRRVRIQASGTDQGWVGDRNAGSWSWFEVGVRKRIGEDGDGDGDVQRRLTWARNPVASREWHDHEVAYHMDDGVDELSEEAREFTTWVESLENGDRVSVIPMARFQAWECTARTASIDLEVEIWW